MLVNAANEANVAPSIAQKSRKNSKANGDFAKFLQDLGKTTNPGKVTDSAPPKSANNANLAQSNIAKSPKILAKNAESPLLKTALSPQDSANPSKDIVKTTAPGTQSRANPADIIANNALFTPKDSPSTPKNSAPNATKGDILKTLLQDSAPAKPQKVADNPSEMPQNPRPSAPNNIRLNAPQMPVSRADSTPNATRPAPNAPNNPNQVREIPQNASNATSLTPRHSAPTTQNQARIAPSPQDSTNPAQIPSPRANLTPSAQMPLNAPSVESRANIAPNDDNSSDSPRQDSANSGENTQDNNANLAQNTPQNAQSSSKNTKSTPLPITHTLKYAVFKAFDALSLLKPSNGKKISDLIKKADELALNLSKLTLKSDTKPQTPPLNPTNAQNTQDFKNAALQSQLNTARNDTAQNAPSAPNVAQNPVPNPASAPNAEIPTQVQNVSPNAGDSESSENPRPREASNTQNREPNNAQTRQNGDILKDALNADKIAQNAPKSPENSALNVPRSDSAQLQNPAQSTQSQNAQNAQNAQSIAAQESRESENPSNATQRDSRADIKPVRFKPQDSLESRADDKPKMPQNALDSTAQTKTNETPRHIEAREVVRSFANALRQEIIDFKPPLSKITLELSPANLGSVEVSITHQGKNIAVSLNTNQQALNLFIQNQSELRAALAQIGYENITMSFSNGAQMGFSDSRGHWRFAHNPHYSPRGEGESEDSQMANLEIMIVENYA